MVNHKLRRVDRWMRSLHLYSGLFLAPWMLVYAASAFCLNHNQWFRDALGITPPNWEPIRQVDFQPGDGFPPEPAAQAEAILRELQLEGPHRLQRPAAPGPMTIIRISGGGNYRVIWRRQARQITVERQTPFSAYRLLHYLHFRAGYQQRFPALIAWAALVDATAFTILFWVVSGIYLWLRRWRGKVMGSVCLAASIGVFGLLVYLLCQ